MQGRVRVSGGMFHYMCCNLTLRMEHTYYQMHLRDIFYIARQLCKIKYTRPLVNISKTFK